MKLSTFDLNTATIYDLLENELYINLSEAEQSITTHQINKQEATHLEIHESSTVLRAERVIYDQFGKAVESYQGLYRPDMYVFRIKTKRKLL
ncbi:UTRA domain-containing protein [Oceanobacillus polygoni]|uniref:DNA-binding GntR family transcriptional regulator n=1 Tax=Oceanobacillus polygoni TaxID=1235259 RepID=A0A9X0YSC7_9BACI|nr:UTRA domain-containing protein [Oceanobacillus polygoni]MBP2077197.1 DNA-binding GntR family transcriptional regulator [Oceanobacillus polygoni]